MADTGNGASIVFGTSGFTSLYRILGETEQTRDTIEDSDLATSNLKTYIPGDLAEPGSFDIEFIWDPTATQLDITDVPETVTVTLPKENSGSAAAATLAGTAFLTKVTKGPSLQNGELNMGKATVQWDGKTEPSYTVEA